MTAKIMYVWYPMLLNATGVIITTWKSSTRTPRLFRRLLAMKLKSQFADVDRAFAGALIRNGTISNVYLDSLIPDVLQN